MYNEEVMSRFLNPSFVGNLKGANAVGSAQEPKTSEIVKFYLIVDEDGVVNDAKFKAFGSPLLIALSDATTQMLIGMSVKDLDEINEARILSLIDDIPRERLYYSFLIVSAISDTTDDYYKRLRRLQNKLKKEQQQNAQENPEIINENVNINTNSNYNDDDYDDYSDFYDDEE